MSFLKTLKMNGMVAEVFSLNERLSNDVLKWFGILLYYVQNVCKHSIYTSKAHYNSMRLKATCQRTCMCVKKKC